jgi:hypothetical protein
MLRFALVVAFVVFSVGLGACVVANVNAAGVSDIISVIPERPFGCVNKIAKEAIKRYINFAQDEFGRKGSFEYEVNQSNRDKREFSVTVTADHDNASAIDIRIVLSAHKGTCNIVN